MLRNYKFDKYFNSITIQFSINTTHEENLLKLYLGHYFIDLEKIEYIIFNKYHKTNVYFNSYSIQNLETKNYLCNPFLNNKLISTIDEIDLCKINCLFDICYERYKCLH